MRLSRSAAAVALAAALALTTSSAHASSDTAGGGLHVDPAESAALDLTGAGLGQEARSLVLTVRAAAPIDPAQLSGAGGGELCATFQPSTGVERRLCLTRGASAWQLRAGSRTVAGSVGQPTPERLAIRFDPAALGLTPGPTRWRVYARAAGCRPGPTAPAGGCVDRAPDSGTFPGRVWRVIVTGCTATGPTEVRGGPPDKRIALSFDDGPATDTPAFVGALTRLGVPATFFMIGRQVAQLPATARLVLGAGDAIGDHSWDHANLGGGGPAATTEIVRTNEAIRRATGYRPCLFRPPYGATGPDLVARVRAQGMTSVLWNVDPSDWARPGSAQIVARVLAQTTPGAIVIMHDGGGDRSQTLAALPTIVQQLRARGFTFVTVPQLLGYREQVVLAR
ncbi:MAG TPA: polysaccharide deacetylase family protein [Solirubrobacteraceae bacterium]|nr:polysaccharide deacetylase family protein [Solirubrobacteraceae bacterium]